MILSAVDPPAAVHASVPPAVVISAHRALGDGPGFRRPEPFEGGGQPLAGKLAALVQLFLQIEDEIELIAVLGDHGFRSTADLELVVELQNFIQDRALI